MELLQLMEWRKVALIHTGDRRGEGMYEYFYSNAALYEIEILNEELKIEVEGAVEEQVKEIMSELVTLHVRIIVFLGDPAVALDICKAGSEVGLAGILYNYIGLN